MRINNLRDRAEVRLFLERLKDTLKENGYTLQAMADSIGCTRQKLWAFFRSQAGIDLNTAYLILEELHLPLEIGSASMSRPSL